MEIGRGPPADAPAEMFRALADPTRRVGVLAAAGLIDLRRRQASIRPDGLRRLSRYFDAALTSAAITSPGGRAAVSESTQK
ncbi:hypothetical protein [Phenylobacterium sp. CCH12-B4]|uniref:hypothetical protein n=1 Tax=Phenylobacterium sp. CCH12-B4 TaxID=1768784 RepID=UPI000839E5AB|nr:hypothetical protein [Phenylobacterium sp. CCH12-B4]